MPELFKIESVLQFKFIEMLKMSLELNNKSLRFYEVFKVHKLVSSL
jgi:hypothetical protein